MDKPTVYYVPHINNPLITVGQAAFITVYDHPRKEGISPARTSRVISHDPITGNFETRNTMYKLLDTGE